MAKVKLSLTAKPTFTAKVAIPVPGEKPVEVEFTFMGRTRDKFRELYDASVPREDLDMVMDIVSGWDLEDAFTRENVDTLLQNYLGAATAISTKYIAEMNQARLGN